MAISEVSPVQANEIAESWFAKFQSAASQSDAIQLSKLFHPKQAYLRDILTFSWDFRTLDGQGAIQSYLEKDGTLKKSGVKSLKMEGDAMFVPASPEYSWIQAMFSFETTIARGRGLFRLMEDNSAGDWKALTAYMGIEELKGHEEQQLASRPRGVEHGTYENRQSWRQRRIEEQEYRNHHPQVLIIGAGHSGLTVAARLRQLKVDTLVIDQNERVGDNWRKRYEFLVLHDPVWYDHLPYIPFPSHWPIFSPKDKLADWLENYAKAMELNVWLKTTISKANYDQKTGTWTIDMTKDGQERSLKPNHVILATGHSGEPHIPTFPGQEKFKGKICHSSQHTTGGNFRGKKAVVVGCCNSGHDIAQDFVEQGADTTMVQRSSTYIVTSNSVLNVCLAPLYMENGPSVEDADVIFASIPNKFSEIISVGVAKACAEADREVLDGLAKAGFKTNEGDGRGGILMTYFKRGGGYYIDVGASTLIAEGKIKIKQGHEIASINEKGLVFDDNSTLEADIIVLATGYKNMKTTAERILGKAAEPMGEVWGLDEEGEIKTMWRPSGHSALWAMGGNLALCRFNSKRLALQIKARLEGLAPAPQAQ